MTNTIVTLVKEVSEDKSKHKEAAICSEMLVTHSKVLNISRIMPKMTMTAKDAIDLYRVGTKIDVNKGELLSVYEVFVE